MGCGGRGDSLPKSHLTQATSKKLSLYLTRIHETLCFPSIVVYSHIVEFQKLYFHAVAAVIIAILMINLKHPRGLLGGERECLR